MVRKRELSLTAERFSPAWWLEGARNFFWVAVITLLIWVYADLEMAEPREFTATLRLMLGKAQQTVIVGDTDTAVTFSVKGSKRAMAQFERWLTDNDEMLEIDVSGYDPGFYSMPAVQILSQSPDITKHGLEVQAAAPAALKFQIDRLESRKAPVRFDHVGATLAEGTGIDPHEVTVTIATSDWQRIDLQTDQPEILTTRRDLSTVRPGREETIQLPLVPSIGTVPVQLSHKAVTVTFQVVQREGRITMAVPVSILSPVEWTTDGTWSEYVLQKKDPDIPWRAEITVTGAKKDLEQLGPEDVRALVVLTDDDREPVASWLERAVEVRFPPELQLQLVGERPTVQFKLVRRGE